MKPKIVFMGTPEFAVASLDAIIEAGYEVGAVVTVPDKKSGRGMKVTFSAVKEYALSHGLTILQPERLRDEEFIEELKSVGNGRVGVRLHPGEGTGRDAGCY